MIITFIFWNYPNRMYFSPNQYVRRPRSDWAGFILGIANGDSVSVLRQFFDDADYY